MKRYKTDKYAEGSIMKRYINSIVKISGYSYRDVI